MVDPAKHPHCSEMYVVEKTIEVEVNLAVEGPSTIRIEALRDLEGEGDCSTRAYIRTDVTIQPTYPQKDGRFESPPTSIEVWARYELPWTDRRSADEALNQALSFLEERCKPLSD